MKSAGLSFANESRPPFTFLEFFAGGGMARLGLGRGWRCLFANDFDAKKAETYRANWGSEDLRLADVWSLGRRRPARPRPDLAWASSPCQDFSLAGARAGLAGGRSSAFWGFWRLIEALDDQGRAPRALVLENVGGLLSSHGGADFAAVCEALAGRGYRFGAVEIDARAFLPQSRPRVFIIAARETWPPLLTSNGPGEFHTRGVRAAHAGLDPALQAAWVWWGLPQPPARNTRLADLLGARRRGPLALAGADRGAAGPAQPGSSPSVARPPPAVSAWSPPSIAASAPSTASRFNGRSFASTAWPAACAPPAAALRGNCYWWRMAVACAAVCSPPERAPA